jgi:hypothetical protein
MATEPDIYTDQVLENLARLADDTSALAYFGLLQSAVPSTNDTGTITIGSMTFSTQSVVKSFHNPRSGTIGPIGGSRVVGTNWTFNPLNDPDKLTAMRFLYLWVLNVPMDEVNAQKLLVQYLGQDFTLKKVNQCWFKHGGWHDVPKDACHKFHHHGTYYWIEPGMQEELTQLTFKMLDIATVVPTKPTKPANPSQTVVRKIDPKTNMPIDIQVTRTQDYVANQVTPILASPILIPGVIGAEAQLRGFQHNPDKGVFEEIRPEIHTTPPAAPPDELTLPDRYNNYSSQPMISPGLFSQPPH